MANRGMLCALGVMILILLWTGCGDNTFMEENIKNTEKLGIEVNGVYYVAINE